MRTGARRCPPTKRLTEQIFRYFCPRHSVVMPWLQADQQARGLPDGQRAPARGEMPAGQDLGRNRPKGKLLAPVPASHASLPCQPPFASIRTMMRGGRCIRLLVDPPCRPSPLLSPPFTLELWPHTCPGPAAPHPFLCVCYFFGGGVAGRGKRKGDHLEPVPRPRRPGVVQPVGQVRPRGQAPGVQMSLLWHLDRRRQ